MASTSYKVLLSACPICGQNTHLFLEPCMYDRNGRFYRDGIPSDDENDWIVKCDGYGAITLRGETREDAICNWESKKLTTLSWSFAK